MNAQKFRWAMIAVVVFAGCIPSFHPVYRDQDLIEDSAILGAWAQENNATWKFSERDGKSYRLVYTDNTGEQGRFVAHLAEIDGVRFLDLYPENIQDTAGLYKVHFVPVHTVYMVRQIEPSLKLAAVNLDWLNDYLSQNPDAIEHATSNHRTLITAPTEKLQDFLLKHKDKFTGTVTLHRSSGDVK